MRNALILTAALIGIVGFFSGLIIAAPGGVGPACVSNGPCEPAMISSK